jgi:hypothetical protein
MLTRSVIVCGAPPAFFCGKGLHARPACKRDSVASYDLPNSIPAAGILRLTRAQRDHSRILSPQLGTALRLQTVTA